MNKTRTNEIASAKVQERRYRNIVDQNLMDRFLNNYDRIPREIIEELLQEFNCY